jgi:hypothetical protein
MDIWHRFYDNLFARIDGPLHFRIILQPIMASIFAVIDGIKDAKLGKPAYFWDIVSNPAQRSEQMKTAWKRISKIFILAVVLDVIYQLKVLHWVYIGETLTVAIILAVLPYILLRGPINRLCRLFLKK